MGYMSEIAGNLPEEYLNDNLIFKCLVTKQIEESDAKPDNEFYHFFNNILPDIPPRRKLMYHMYVSEDKKTYADIKFDNKHDYIYALYKMSQFDCYNVFFSLTPYRFSRKKKAYATAVQGFFIDIDDLDFDVLAMTKEDIIDFLTDDYGVPKHLLPQYVSKSGHGLHLFYLLYESLNDEPVREKYAESLVTHYMADFSSSRVTQNIRTPGSYNIKGTPIKTELVRINERSAFNLSDLDWFLKTKTEVDEHHQNDINKRAAKARATREKNQAQRLANCEETNPRKSYKKRKTADKDTSTKQEVKKPEPVDVSKLEYYHYFSKKARNFNLIMDLHNYFIRHNGDIYGLRANFFTIMATYCTYIMEEEQCKEFLCVYADDDFQSELEDIVAFVYKEAREEKKYTYRYETIAKTLAFTQEDIDKSYCSFSEERRIQATKNRKKRAAEKKKAETAAKRKSRNNYVKENYALSNAELAKILSVSERTISRIRATIRQEVA